MENIEAMLETYSTAIENTAAAIEDSASENGTEGEGSKAGVGCAAVFDVYRVTLRNMADPSKLS